MKPLSQKTLAKKYTELGLPKDKTDLLHDYFLACANLYGVISVREAWEVFREYEGVGYVRKSQFSTFAGIAQREPGHPYSILEVDEVFSAEKNDPLNRLIVNNRLIGYGYGRFVCLYSMLDCRLDKPFYLPPDKKSFLINTTDQFWLSPEARKMQLFLGNLRTDGQFRNFEGEPFGEILDIEGHPVAGKRLSDFVFYTRSDEFDIDYEKKESRKEQLRKEYAKTALDKILDRLFLGLHTNIYFPERSAAEIVRSYINILYKDYGVSLTDNQLETFLQLYFELNNHSHLWLNAGWTPSDLAFYTRFPR